MGSHPLVLALSQRCHLPENETLFKGEREESGTHRTVRAEEKFLRGGFGRYRSVLAAGRQFDMVDLVFGRETLDQLVETIQALTSQDDVPATNVDTKGELIDLTRVAHRFKLFRRLFRSVSTCHL